MRRFQSCITKNWRGTGLASIIVTRIDDDGGAVAGFFLVDIFCLGVKDAWLLDGTDEAGLAEVMEARLPKDIMETIHPAWAKKLIEGAVAYAERLGFAPHRDFRKARRVLGGIDAGMCTETFAYGDGGRPHYIQGQADDEERVRRVLAVLDTRCGPDGYDFTSYADLLDDPDISAEAIVETRNTLAAMFEKRDAEFSVHALTGALTAMLCQPGTFDFEDVLMTWSGLVFGDGEDGEGGEDGDAPTPEETLLGIYWRQLERFLEVEMEEGHPIIILSPNENETGEDAPGKIEFRMEFISAMLEWAQGFMDLVGEYEDEWAGALARPDLAQCWKTLRCWAAPFEPDGIIVQLGKAAAAAEAEDGGAGAGDDDAGALDDGAGGKLPTLNDAVVTIYCALHGEGGE